MNIGREKDLQIPEDSRSPEGQSKAAKPRHLVRTRTREMYKGPIPDPQMFADFERALPGLANRVMALSENQSKHRHKIETRVIWFDGGKSILGLILAFLVVVSGIGAGVYLIMHDKDLYGLTALIAPIATVAIAYVKQHAPEKEDKARNDGTKEHEGRGE